MQENRSFDHYFGTLSGVRGFSDPRVATNRVNGPSTRSGDQFGYQPGVGVDPTGFLQPFDLQQSSPPRTATAPTTSRTNGTTQHHELERRERWTAFVQAHLAADGVTNFAATMGYFDRCGPPLLLRAGRRLHHLRRLPLLGAGTHRPQPRAWPCRAPSTPPARAAVRSSSRRPAAGRSSTGRSTGPPCPSSLLDAGVTWKVYNDPDRPRPLQSAALLQGLQRPARPAGTQLPAAGARPQLPRRLHRRRGGGDPAPGELDPWTDHPVRAPGHGAAVGREPGADRPRHADLQPRGLGPHPVHPQLRRERRVLRPRPAAGPAARVRRAST